MATVERSLETPGAECDLSADLGWLLSTASFSLATEINRAFADAPVSPRGYHVLAAAMDGEHTQSDLVDIVGLDKTTMVTTVDALEAAGLAERKPSPHDRRARVIAVTPAGVAAVRRGRAIVEGVQQDVLATLPAKSRAAFLEGLACLVAARLDRPAPCADAPRRKRMPKQTS